MDWTLCVVCQKATHEQLKWPLNSERPGEKSEAYSSFLENVNEFRKLDQLPVSLSFGQDVDVGQLMRNQAKWHKSCHLKFCAYKLQRARKRKMTDATDHDSSAQDKKRLRQHQPFDKSSCIFCKRHDGRLHEFRTLDASENVRRMAMDLQDTAVLAAIEGGDLIALDAKYHLVCLAVLRNRHRSFIRQNQKSDSSHAEERKTQVRVFVELITYVENAVEDGQFCFKFSSLHHLYESHLKILGICKEVNRTRFKEQVLRYFPSAQQQSDGKNAILVFEKGMQEILKQTMKCDHEEDALILMKAAKIVRADIFQSKGFNFNGSFLSNCQQESLPTTFKSLVTMLLKGADMMEQDCAASQAMESIPPTQDALLQHSKRVAYQAGIWTTSDLAQQQPPSPEGHGWTFDRESQSWVPVWSTLPLSSIYSLQ